MKLKQFNIIIVMLFCSAVLCWADEKVESQIGPFNFADSPMMESRLISSYGKGYVQIDKVGGKVLGKKHIYYVADINVWIEIRLSHVLNKNMERFVEAVLITKNKLCDEKFEPKTSFGPLLTGKGIKIGDTKEKTIRTYGSPSLLISVGADRPFSVLREDLKLKKGEILRYLPNQSNELLFSEFYFDDAVLHSILISRSE